MSRLRSASRCQRNAKRVSPARTFRLGVRGLLENVANSDPGIRILLELKGIRVSDILSCEREIRVVTAYFCKGLLSLFLLQEISSKFAQDQDSVSPH